MSEKAVPLLVLDIDGTVRKGFDQLGRFVNGPEDVEVYPQAVEMMGKWRRRGGRIIGVSNQGGIALGHVDPEAVAKAMLETQNQAFGQFDKLVWCSHHPDANDPEMARCWCRKPAIGMIVEGALDIAARFSEYYPPHMGLMVGDRPEDAICAATASLDFMDAGEWRLKA